MEDVVQALMMAFAVIVFVIALSLSMYMISQVTSTSEILAFYSDSTRYYDNIKLNDEGEEAATKDSSYTERTVSAETIIPTLYRYYKENFCVKIYDADDNLIQVFDVNIEGQVNQAVADTKATATSTDKDRIRNYSLNVTYNDSSSPIYMFGAPWLGSTENVKTRVDYFVNGSAGYINNKYVNYTNNKFYEARQNGTKFKERFINYSYSGETMQTDDGDTLVTGASEKDKIVIIYTMIK
jgi:hypothetical protein